jgi:outer membrane usher protein
VRPDPRALLLCAALLGAAPAAALVPHPVPALVPHPVPELAVASGPAYLTLDVNDVVGEPVLVLVEGGDVWVSPRDLATLGLRVEGGVRRDDGGRALVSLRSLAPGVSFSLDDAALAVRITADPTLLGRSSLDLRPSMRPPGLETGSTPAVFVNGSARGTTAGDLSAFGETGLSWSDHLALTSVSRLPGGSVVRGLSSLTAESPAHLLRYLLGDGVVTADPLGGGPIVMGVGIARDPGIDPYLVRSPLPRASGFARTPSTLEVWVNGALLRTVPVAPGSYDVSNLPVTTGSNDVRLVLRDAFGRVEVVQAGHYQAQGLLAKGLHEFSWNAGAVREGFGVRSFELGDPVIVGRHRLGVTDALTLGGRVEATPHLASGGLTAVVGFPVGELQLAGAASAKDRAPGGAALVAWRTSLREASFGADLTWQSSGYATSSSTGPGPRTLWRAGVNASAAAGRDVTLQLQGLLGRLTDGSDERRLESNAYLRVGHGLFVQLGATVAETSGGHAQLTALLAILLAPDATTSVDTSAQVTGDTVRKHLGAQRPLPIGEGVGYRVSADAFGPQDQLSALAQAQASYGRLELGYDRSSEQGVGSLAAAAGLVLLDGKVFATRPLDQSYALVRVPGVPGVRAYLNNQPVGRTDSDGDVLVPGLLPYYGNRMAIADADVPLRYNVGRTERLVAPPRRGGALVRFDVAPLRAVTGRLSLSGGPSAVPPAYGTLYLELEGRTLSSPITADGAFWLEDVPAGAHRARVLWRGLTCALALSVPNGAAGIVDLGELGCAVQDRDPPAGAPEPRPL